MLDGLDDIDWNALRHAYGPAGDVPGQLRALRAGDEDTRKAAREKLYGNIFHQGDRYPASPYAVPFLLELVADPATPDRPHLLFLLSGLAIGYDEYVLPHGVPPGFDEPTYLEVAKGTPLFRDLLRSGDPPLETAAAGLLGWFPGDAAASLEALWARLEEPRWSGTAGACLCAIGLLGAPGDAALAARLAAHVHADDVVRRCSAAIALARIAGDDPPKGALDALLLAARGEAPEIEEPGIFYREGELQGYAAECLQLLGPSMRPAAVDAIAHSLPSSNLFTALPLVHGLLPLAFDAPVPPGTPFSALAPHQQRALQGLMTAEWFVTGRGFVNVNHMLAHYGLPPSAPELDAYIRGLPPKKRRWWRR